MEFNRLEDQLRAEGAPLPPALRRRVLHRCAEESRNRQRWHRRFDLCLSGACAGLCLLYWLAIGLLDAQRMALMFPAGSTGHEAILLAQLPTDSPASVASTLEWHSRTLAALLANREATGFVYAREVNDVARSTGTPFRTPAGAKSG